MPHRTPLRMLFPPVPAFPLEAGQAALLVLDYQPFMTDRSVGLGQQAAERGIERELDEYYEQVEYGLRNTGELVQAFRAAGQPVRPAASPGRALATLQRHLGTRLAQPFVADLTQRVPVTDRAAAT